MSDYHVLERNIEETTWRVAFHIPVPDSTNDAGYSLRTAISESRHDIDGLVPTVVKWISAPELQQLQDGEIYEEVRHVTVGPTDTIGEQRAMVDAVYNDLKTTDRTMKSNYLQWYGYDGTVT